MAVFEDTLYTRIIADASQATDELNKFSKLGKQMGFISKAGGDINNQMKQIKENVGGNSAAWKVFNSNLKESKNRFDMNTLSYLFAGMAMQRMGLSIMRFMIPSMDTLTKLNTTASKKIMGVYAAFEFMKVSIFETLMAQPLVQDFVAWLIKAFVQISEFVQKHPNWTVALAAIGVAFTALGSAIMGIGLAKQIGHVFKLGWSTLSGWIGITGKGGKFGKALSGAAEYWKTALGVTSIAVGIALAVDMLTSESDVRSRLAGTLGMTMAGAIAGLMFGGPVGAIIGGAIGFGVGLIVSITDYFIEDKPTFSDLKNILDKLFGNWKSALGSVGLNIVSGGLYIPLRIIFGTMAETDKRQRVEASSTMAEEQMAKIRELASPLGGDAQLGYMLMTEGNYDLQTRYIQDLLDKEKSLEEATGLTNAERVKQAVELEKQRTSLSDLIPNYYTMENQIRNGIQATSEMGEKTKEVTDMQIEQYASAFAEQLKSDDKTKELIKNAELFGTTVADVFGGKDDKIGVIGQFNAFGEAITLDNEYFDTLKTDIEDWASTITVKTVKIKYVHEGSGGDGEEGFFERVGRSADSLVGSVTGG